MTFLYFIFDVCLYNYTMLKTDFLVHSLLDKKENKYIYFFSILFIDFLLMTKGQFFLIYTILFFLNKKIKISYQNITSLFLRFFILYIIYKIGVFLLFQKFVFDILGFLFNLIIIFVSYKKF